MGNKIKIENGVKFMEQDLSYMTGNIDTIFHQGFCSIILDEYSVRNLSRNYLEKCTQDGLNPAFVILRKDKDFKVLDNKRMYGRMI